MTAEKYFKKVLHIINLYDIFICRKEMNMSIKKTETTRISLVLDNETLEKIKTIAKNNKTSMSTIIREAIWTTFLFNTLEEKNENNT